jgi:hypothetical protein
MAAGKSDVKQQVSIVNPKAEGRKAECLYRQRVLLMDET